MFQLTIPSSVVKKRNKKIAKVRSRLIWLKDSAACKFFVLRYERLQRERANFHNSSISIRFVRLFHLTTWVRCGRKRPRPWKCDGVEFDRAISNRQYKKVPFTWPLLLLPPPSTIVNKLEWPQFFYWSRKFLEKMDIENQGVTSEEDLSSSDDELDFDGKFSFIYALILALKH